MMKRTEERISDLREDTDTKKYVLAELLGVSSQQYARYENGTSELPVKYACILADHYGVTLDYLLGRTDKTADGRIYSDDVVDGYPVDAMVDDVMSLSPSARRSVVKYVKHWKR